MNIGAHVSVAGGISNSIANAIKIGADGIQSFASSPRSINFTPYSATEIAKYNSAREKSPIKFHVFHGVYLVNLAHENPEYIIKCIESLSYYQQLAGKIAGLGTVFHTGSHKGRGLEAVLDQVVNAIVQILQNTPNNVTLYLENAAGQNGTIGQSFEELAQIIKAVEEKTAAADKLAICLDTQHAFASGYDLRSKTGVNNMIQALTNALDIDRLRMIHANDSLTPLGSNRDRHANIGQGEIGIEGFKALVNHPMLTKLPWVLEVPGENKSGPRKEDVELLKSIQGN